MRLFTSFAVVLFLVLLVIPTSAAEPGHPLPSPLSIPSVDGTPVLDADSEAETVLPGIRADWGGELRSIRPDQRANARIHLDILGVADKQATALLATVETLWNDGLHDAAIEQITAAQAAFPDLDLVISGDWLTPLATEDNKGFGDDVRIGNLENIYDLDMDVHYESGVIFVAVVCPGATSASYIAINRSNDNGLSWDQTSWVSFSTAVIRDIDVAVISDYLYVAYATASVAGVRRFDVSTGQYTPMPDDSPYHTVWALIAPDSVVEISMVSNQDLTGVYPRLYMLTLSKNHHLLLAWNDPEEANWNSYPTDVHSADRGLDLCMNEGYTDHALYATYIDTSDVMHVDGTKFAGWDSIRAFALHSGSCSHTTISAYQDTFFSFFEYYETRLHIRCLFSYDDGEHAWWDFADGDSVTCEAPDACLRRGGGVAAIYRFYHSPREGRFRWRDYSAGSTFGHSTIYADNEPYWNQPSIEYLGAGQYGIAYLTNRNPYDHAAYFDRGATHCCVGNRGNIDGSPDDEITLGDLNVLIDHLFVSYAPLRCWEEANIDGSLPEGDESISLGDLAVLIDHLFVSFADLRPCP